jgi:AcrR family transcriptional regulator
MTVDRSVWYCQLVRTKTTTERASARERLLDAANELFYEHGVHSVGIDRVIEHAGVAKASLYACFGSKEGLIRAYLEARQDAIKKRMTRELARYETPRQRLIGVFEIQGVTFSRPGYRGCAFAGASVESPAGSCVEQVSRDYRGWLRALLIELATQAGASEPEVLAHQLVLLFDGAAASAWMDRDPTAAVAAVAMATALLDAAGVA